MKHVTLYGALGAALAATAAGSAYADFAGQTILANLIAGSVVSGDTTGATDDNDGWFSGTHIFDLWDGGDDVYTLDWAGGDLELTLTYDNSGFNDLDLFLYTPADLNDSLYDSIGNTGVDSVAVAGAAGGTYYIIIDSSAGAEGPYTLRVSDIPAPGAITLAGLAFANAARRRRR